MHIPYTFEWSKLTLAYTKAVICTWKPAILDLAVAPQSSDAIKAIKIKMYPFIYFIHQEMNRWNNKFKPTCACQFTFD